MKKYLIQSIKVIAIAILIGSGTFAVSAWTAPTVNPPATGVVRVPANDTAQGVFAALNTTVFPQIKKGGLIISDENKYLVSPLSFFKKVLLPEEDTSVYVGGVGTADPTFATAANFPEDRSVPLTINMSGRSSEGAIKYIADTDACAGPTKIITDSSAFQFWNDGKNDHADILAKGIRLTGGNPAAGKILISVDRDGRAVWATPRLAANGVDILFDTDTSPVGTCNPVAPIAGCTDPTATNYNPNATVNNGSCIQPVDLCTNIAGTQTTVPAGMVKDTTGNTPGVCTTSATYNWDVAPWGQCNIIIPGVDPTFSTNWEPVSNNSYLVSKITYGPDLSSLGKYCPASTSFTYTTGTGTRSRSVLCKDSNGNTVADSFCPTPKPDIVDPVLCVNTKTKQVEYRVIYTKQSLNSGRVYSQQIIPNNCLYRKPSNTSPWMPSIDPTAFFDLYPLSCKALAISDRTTSISGFYTAGSVLGFNSVMSEKETHCSYLTTPDADFQAPPSGFHPGGMDGGTEHQYIYEYRLKP